MICPACSADIDPPEGLSVCPVCPKARTLVREGDSLRLATAADLKDLSAGEIQALRKSRPAVWRADVTARLKQIRGR